MATRRFATDPDWRQQLDAVIRDLEGKTEGPPTSVDEVHQHVALRLLYLTAARRQDALREIQGISPTEQDFWKNQIYALATYLDVEQNPNPLNRATAANRHLSQAAEKLGELCKYLQSMQNRNLHPKLIF